DKWREEMRASRLSLTLLMIVLSLAPSSRAARAAQPVEICAGAKCQIYLSLIAHNPQVMLFAPTSGASISSLAPVLAWWAPIAGMYRIQVTEDSAFAPTSSFAVSETKDVKEPLPAQIITLINTNLKPLQTYYWRVEKKGKESGVFSASAYFKTPAKNDRLLPPGVQLLSPANNGSVAASNVVLSWQPLTGALYYRFRVYDANNVLVSGIPAEVDAAMTSIGVPNLIPGM